MNEPCTGLRLFAALPVPSRVRDQIAAATAPLRRRFGHLRWTPPEQWHVTVTFIGRTAVAVDDVARVLVPAAREVSGPIRLDVSDAGRFGRRVLWLGIEDRPAGAVAGLGAAAKAALRGAGFEVDEREVRPHLTLARAGRGGRQEAASPGVRGSGAVAVTEAAKTAVPHIGATWQVDSLVVYSSEQRGRGQPNRYVPRRSVPLGTTSV